MANFQTKDSGERVQFQTGMHRDTNTGKALFHLMFPLGVPYKEQMLTRLAELYGRGAQKYAARNWELARTREELERFKESAFRHFVQWLTGETDEDHAAAVLFNVIGAEYVEFRLRQAEAESEPMRLPDGSGFFVGEVAGPDEDNGVGAAIEEAIREEGRRSEVLGEACLMGFPAEELRVDKDTGRVYLEGPAPLAAPPQPQYPVTLRVISLDPDADQE